MQNNNLDVIYNQDCAIGLKHISDESIDLVLTSPPYDNLRFYGAAGNIMTMGGWHECEEWLNGVVFDDPQISDRVEIILHPERFPERDPQRAALRAVEDAVEQNDNNFDGIINNLPEPDPAEALRQQARQSEQAVARDSVLEELKAQREKAELAEKAKRRPQLFRDPDERERV